MIISIGVIACGTGRLPLPPEKIDQEIGVEEEHLRHYLPADLGSREDPISLAPDSGKIGQILAPLPEASRALDDGHTPGGIPSADEPVNCIPNQLALCTARSCGHGFQCRLLGRTEINLCAIHERLAMYVRNVCTILPKVKKTVARNW